MKNPWKSFSWIRTPVRDGAVHFPGLPRVRKIMRVRDKRCATSLGHQNSGGARKAKAKRGIELVTCYRLQLAALSTLARNVNGIGFHNRVRTFSSGLASGAAD
jgi:hypothetical protein